MPPIVRSSRRDTESQSRPHGPRIFHTNQVLPNDHRREHKQETNVQRVQTSCTKHIAVDDMSHERVAETRKLRHVLQTYRWERHKLLL